MKIERSERIKKLPPYLFVELDKAKRMCITACIKKRTIAIAGNLRRVCSRTRLKSTA